VDLASKPSGERSVTAKVRHQKRTTSIEGEGNGPIDAFVSALQSGLGLDLNVLGYSEHSVGEGAKAKAIAYVQAQVGKHSAWGVGRHESILTASILAVLSSVNRGLAAQNRTRAAE
jgi:2-isopropylmalate synthase